MNDQRYFVSREGRGYIIWDRHNRCKVSIVARRKADAQAEADRLNADEAAK